VQTRQDIAWCEQRFPGVRPRAISAQFMDDDKIAMFELTIKDNQVLVVDEKHYRLTSANQLDRVAITTYR